MININLKQIFASDDQSLAADKMNYNYQRLLELGIGQRGKQGDAGPAGQGIPGPIGTQGERGSYILSGTGIPSIIPPSYLSQFRHGDNYWDVDALFLYEYNSLDPMDPASSGYWSGKMNLSEYIINSVSEIADSSFTKIHVTEPLLNDRFVTFRNVQTWDGTGTDLDLNNPQFVIANFEIITANNPNYSPELRITNIPDVSTIDSVIYGNKGVNKTGGILSLYSDHYIGTDFGNLKNQLLIGSTYMDNIASSTDRLISTTDQSFKLRYEMKYDTDIASRFSVSKLITGPGYDSLADVSTNTDAHSSTMIRNAVNQEYTMPGPTLWKPTVDFHVGSKVAIANSIFTGDIDRFAKVPYNGMNLAIDKWTFGFGLVDNSLAYDTYANVGNSIYFNSGNFKIERIRDHGLNKDGVLEFLDGSLSIGNANFADNFGGGGTLNLTAGYGTTGSGGPVYIYAGDSDTYGGNVNITAGGGTQNGIGGHITLTSGRVRYGTSGDIRLVASNSDGDPTVGKILIGTSTPIATSSRIQLLKETLYNSAGAGTAPATIYQYQTLQSQALSNPYRAFVANIDANGNMIWSNNIFELQTMLLYSSSIYGNPGTLGIYGGAGTNGTSNGNVIILGSAGSVGLLPGDTTMRGGYGYSPITTSGATNGGIINILGGNAGIGTNATIGGSVQISSGIGRNMIQSYSGNVEIKSETGYGTGNISIISGNAEGTVSPYYGKSGNIEIKTGTGLTVGSINITGGTGGNPSGPVGADGGNITIDAGLGGVGGGGVGELSGNGGNISIQAGKYGTISGPYGSIGNNGRVTIQSGSISTIVMSADIKVEAGPGIGQIGGSIDIIAGAGNSSEGGSINVIAGTGQIGGSIDIIAGNGTYDDNSNGGAITIKGGDGRYNTPSIMTIPGNGGSITIQGGKGGSSIVSYANGANVIIKGGEPGSSGGGGGRSGSVSIGNYNDLGLIINSDISMGVGTAGPLYLDSTSRLTTIVSSIVYKENVSYEIDSDILYQLKPVTFNYKKDPAKNLQFGLIAEDVELIVKDLVFYRDGVINSVNYNGVFSLAIAALQKLKAENDQLKSDIAAIKQHLGL